MEKEQKSSLSIRKNEKDFEQIYEAYITEENALKKAKLDLIDKLSRIRQSIEAFRMQLKLVKNPSDKIIEELKMRMDQIDAALVDFKQANLAEAESLQHEEKILSREVDAYEIKITNWMKNPNVLNANRPKSKQYLSEKLIQSDLIKEVVDFDVNMDFSDVYAYEEI